MDYGQAEQKEPFIFDGIKTKKAQSRVLRLLKSCKEIRDTAYPLKNSKVTELTLIDLHARKQKDYIYVTGTLSLSDNGLQENRTFEAYITSKEGEDHVLLDITRVDSKEGTSMIRTTDIITEANNSIISVTSYCGIGYLQEKIFSSEFPKEEAETFEIQTQQLSVL